MGVIRWEILNVKIELNELFPNESIKDSLPYSYNACVQKCAQKFKQLEDDGWEPVSVVPLDGFDVKGGFGSGGTYALNFTFKRQKSE